MRHQVLCFIFLMPYLSKSQDFVGFNQSLYAGVTGVYQQPASIVDSRMRFDMNLAGFNVGAYNNYVGIKKEALKNLDAVGDADFQSKYVIPNKNGKDKALLINNRMALPSFMISLNAKNAIAFQWSMRNYMNVDGVSQNLADQAYNQFIYPTLYVTDLNIKHLSIQEMTWEEYGLTYARVLKDDNEHFFKAGVTVKLIRGLQSCYLFLNNLHYNFQTDTSLSLLNTEIRYGHSDNIHIKDISLKGQESSYSFDFRKSYYAVAFDVGAVYEWRPHFLEYKYDLDGEKGLWRNNKTKYKLKVGVSMTDLGSVKFKKGDISNDFNANVGYWNLKPISPQTVGNLNDTFSTRFDKEQTKNTYKMNLPLAFSAQVDYHIWKDVYVNLTPYMAIRFKKNDTKVHDWSSVTLTPRWDHRWFGVFMPLQYNFLDGLRAGTALRIGPLVVGTTNVTPLVSQRNISGVDAYMLLKVPIPYGKPKDKDKDGISNKKDQCRDVPGVWEFMGCPDADGDHIKDSEDKCPDVPGTKELQGCPDKDGDGITDKEDDCPDERGLAELKGCPDRDADGLMDKDDLCPDDKGPTEFKGCPDKDGDKTPDKDDACPDVSGPLEYKGCPDKDGDAVLDKEDNCPEVAGSTENKGCPWPDTDQDGLTDREDDCPSTPGLKELKGCPPAPVLKAEEQKILEKAFSSLEFASGKDVIKTNSYASLNELAGLMKQHAMDWTLKLAGHTDNQGNPAKNMILSEKRTKAVKKYLVTKGVKADQIMTEWFGQTVPITDNATETGRQKNRRVEMKVVFK